MFNARNGTIRLEGDSMDYVVFGRGEQALIILPGLGDGLKTVKGLALPFALLYRKLAKSYRVYVLSRRNRLPQAYSSRDMAGDVIAAMDELGLERAHLIGVSQGGTIAQHVALDAPGRVDKLILAATYAKANETVRAVVGGWMACAQRGDYAGLFVDMSERMYSEKTLKKNRKWYAVMKRVGAPKAFDRFMIQAQACMTHDAQEQLAHIACPTLVIGGGRDRIVTAQASIDMAERICQSRLLMYADLGHALYEEAPDFWDNVLAFLKDGGP